MSSPSDLPIPTEDDAELVERLDLARSRYGFLFLVPGNAARLLAIARWAVEAARGVRLSQAGAFELHCQSYERGIQDALANPEAARRALEGQS